jgi:DNA invertase Pin-like site-specific DNA recombinase
MKPCFGYCRVSSIGQAAEDRDGLIRQRTAIIKYAESHDLTIKQFFEDKLTGKTDMENRPQLQEMLSALLANGVKTVIVERLDRLARDLMVQEKIIGDFQQKKFELVSTEEPDLCSKDPSRVFMRQVLGAVAQFERAMIFAKTQAAKQRKAASDPTWTQGRKPYGHRPGEQEIISRVMELHGQKIRASVIARTLNAEGRKTRTGIPFAGQQVLDIIRRRRAKQHLGS